MKKINILITAALILAALILAGCVRVFTCGYCGNEIQGRRFETYFYGEKLFVCGDCYDILNGSGR